MNTMHIKYSAVIVASFVQFAIGAVWYTPIFGKLWGRIHGFDTASPEAQAAMRKSVGPLLAIQFIITIVTTFVFALLLQGFPGDWNVYGLAGFFWAGFVLPTQISAVIFGGTSPKWMLTKIAVSAGCSLLCLEAAAAILKAMA